MFSATIHQAIEVAIVIAFENCIRFTIAEIVICLHFTREKTEIKTRYKKIHAIMTHSYPIQNMLI